MLTPCLVLLLDNTRVYRYESSLKRFVRHRSILIDDDRIVALDSGLPAGARRRDMDGATILPAFADCHVHLAGTGYVLGERSLGAVRSYDAFDRAVATIPRDDGAVYAGKYDDALWADGKRADAAPLERHHADVRAMVVRVDSHSCIVNRAALVWLDLPRELPGIEYGDDGVPTGRLALDANWRAQSQFVGAFSTSTVRAAQRRATEAAIRRGVVHLHAQLLGRGREGYEDDVAALRALPAKIHPKVCEPDATLARDLGLNTIGGDVFLDGSLGSCTAALREPYCDGEGSGSLRFSDEQIYDYFKGADDLGIAAGVHAIGDAAIDQCVRAWQRVLDGKPSRRNARHFIEHFEMATDEHIAACAAMNIHLSMQPQFDAAWGNAGGMYDTRLGKTRAATMNPIAKIVASGANVCGGSDSPVCDLDALAGMHACVTHSRPEERLDSHTALALYTVNAARFGYAETTTGNCAPGLAADLVVLDNDPLINGNFAQCQILETWIDGKPVV